MEVVKLIGIVILAVVALFSLKRIVFGILNLRALRSYRRDANPINQRHGMVFNRRTRKLEADQSPILPFD